MIQFSFSCEHCGQVISCSDSDAGQNINCPSCDRPLVIPTPAGRAHSAPVANPSAPHKPTPTRSIAPPTRTFAVPVAAPSAPAKPLGKKKSDSPPPPSQAPSKGAGKAKSALPAIIGGTLIALVCAGGGTWFYFFHKESELAKKIEPVRASTNGPKASIKPAKYVGDPAKSIANAYQRMERYSAQIHSDSSIDMSKVANGKNGPVNTTCDITVQFGKPNLYRIEWRRLASGKVIAAGGVWCSGEGDFALLPNNKYAKLDSRNQAISYASQAATPSVRILAKLFFGDDNAIFSTSSDGHLTHGAFTPTHNELRQSSVTPDPSSIKFGDDTWQNYTLECEAMKLAGQNGFVLSARAHGKDSVNLNIGGFQNTLNSFLVEEKQADMGNSSLLPIQINRWYKLKLSVVGDKYSGWLDDTEIGSVNVPLHSNGGVSLGTLNTAATFRNITVTAPNGKILWSGIPRPLTQEADITIGKERCSSVTTWVDDGKLRVCANNKSLIVRMTLDLGTNPMLIDNAWLADEIEEMSLTSPSQKVKMKTQLMAERQTVSKLRGRITDVFQDSNAKPQIDAMDFHCVIPGNAKLIEMPY